VTPDLLLLRALDEDAGRPLITYYDDATGERTELSVATFANWVAKTANLLVDGLAAEPGQRAGLCLPVHWQSAVWHFACWAAGLVVVTGPSSGGGPAGPLDVVVVPMDAADAEEAGPAAAPGAAAVAAAADVVGLGLGSMGLPRADLEVPPHVTLDYDREISSYGDRFAPRPGADVGLVAVVSDGVRLSAGDLGALVLARVPRDGLEKGARVLTDRPLDGVDDILFALLGPLANGGGTVLCRRLDPSRLPERMAVEHVVAARAGHVTEPSAGADDLD